jgi:hypothetical protein
VSERLEFFEWQDSNPTTIAGFSPGGGSGTPSIRAQLACYAMGSSLHFAILRIEFCVGY